jgi:hypothetical protein
VTRVGWWIALGVLVGALVLLVLVVVPVLARLGRLSRAAARAQARAAQAQTVRGSLEHLQERLDTLASHAEGIKQRAARRG